MISGAAVHEIEHQIRRHPSIFSEIHSLRRVNNVYFDTLEQVAYHDNVAGTSERTKARVRWYGATFGALERPSLELKIKLGPLGRKLRYPIGPCALTETGGLADLARGLAAADLPGRVAQWLRLQRPTLLNSYRRRYFRSNDGECRVTVDTDLRFFHPDPVHTGFRGRRMDHRNAIVELKYAASVDLERARDVASAFGFRMTKSSKYVRGIELLG